MSGLRSVMKDGWHPKGKDGKAESWRGDFKGINQVAGWVGMGKDSSASARAEHVSQPLSSLKDPASFGPPPRRNGSVASPIRTTPDHRGLGAPVSQGQIAPHDAQEEMEENNKPAPPPVPYRVDRTGLKTDNLPPPPVRRDSPSLSDASNAQKPAPRPKPSLPPRLPPRQDTGRSNSPSPPPPPYTATDNTGLLNQGAVSRLGKAGVSVPGLGIGRPGTETNGGSTSDAPSPASRPAATPVNELQSRFAKMSTSQVQSPGTPKSPPTQGTTLEEKQAALKTAQNFHKDPSSVSLSEARSASSTANNFRERHSDQIEAGKKKISALNQKYGITKRFNDFIEDQKSPAHPEPQQAGGPAPPPPPHPNLNRSGSNIDMDALNRRKPPPPPPPPKKLEMQSTPVHSQSPPPPPLPLGTKPR